MIEISSVRHAFPEINGITIDRPFGLSEYTFLHFFESVQIMYQGGIITTQPGAVIIYDKAAPQYFTRKDSLVHNWFHFDGDAKSVLDRFSIEFDTLYYPENQGFITELVYEMESEFYGEKTDREELYNLKFAELILKLSRELKGEGIPQIAKDSQKAFLALRMKMFSDLSRHWTAKEMAEEVGFSESRFYRIYKSLFGTSPTNDLINARMEKAKHMLFFEKKSVGETADALGYDNLTHFIRQFKSRTNFSPSAWQKVSDKN